MAECIVKLPVFEGPLDLLLHLVRKNKLDIFDLPMALITEQYLAYLEMMKALDLDIAGEYLLMAATLIYIKSRLLLPREEPEANGWQEPEDPRREIVEPLLELAKFQEAAKTLAARPLLGADVFSPPGEELEGEEEISVSLFELLAALKEVLGRKPPTPLEVKRARVMVAEKMKEILFFLGQKAKLWLSELFSRARGREEAVAYFLALLELAFRGEVRLLQNAPWEEIEILKR